MDEMTEHEAIKLTRELCAKYDIEIKGVRVRNKKRDYGTAYIGKNKIIYSTLLFKESKWMVLKTVCHEVAHLLATKKYGGNCLHNRRFQVCEIAIDALYGFKPVYARSRGYAVAYVDLVTGKALDCRRGYKEGNNGRVVIDYDKQLNDKLLRKVMKEAFAAKAFNKGDKFNTITCKPIEGRLALISMDNGNNDEIKDPSAVIYQSELKSNNLKIEIKNVKYNGRSLSYNME
jgi:hypothetical protein